MANKPQRKGLIYRITMGKDNLPDFTPDKLPGNRFQLFKDVFFGRFGAMIKINLLSILFALPIVVVLVLAYMSRLVDNSMVPYSGNLGIGYPVVPDAVAIGEARNFILNFQTYLLLIPCIVIFSIGLSGAFYVMRRLAWGEGVGVGAHFFHGIKANVLPFLWSSLFIAVSFFLLMFNISAYNQLQMHTAIKIIGLALTIIQFLIVTCMAMFLTTQAVTYKLKFWGLIKNSFLFSIGLLPINIIILILSALPAVALYFLLRVQFLGVMFLMLFLLVGVSYIILLWTVYAHWVYDKFINDRVEGAVKNRGMYKMSEEEKKARAEKNLIAKNTRFNNPIHFNKQISSIDEGSTFTPLEPTFSRADLVRLAEEKEKVKREIDAEYGDVEEEKPPVEEEKPEKPKVVPENTQKSSSSKAKFTTKKKK